MIWHLRVDQYRQNLVLVGNLPACWVLHAVSESQWDCTLETLLETFSSLAGPFFMSAGQWNGRFRIESVGDWFAASLADPELSIAISIRENNSTDTQKPTPRLDGQYLAREGIIAVMESILPHRLLWNKTMSPSGEMQMLCRPPIEFSSAIYRCLVPLPYDLEDMYTDLCYIYLIPPKYPIILWTVDDSISVPVFHILVETWRLQPISLVCMSPPCLEYTTYTRGLLGIHKTPINSLLSYFPHIYTNQE